MVVSGGRRDWPVMLTVRKWSDPLVEAQGYPVTSDYVETFWLPVLGPSATWALRRLAALAATPGGVRIRTVELARSLGLGASTGRNSAIVRTLERLVRFDMARCVDDVLEVRRFVGPLPGPQLSRLPHALQHAHQRAVCRAGGSSQGG